MELHRKWLAGRDVQGRIYISSQGINAQCGGSLADAGAYAEWVASQNKFQVRLRGSPHFAAPASGVVGSLQAIVTIIYSSCFPLSHC